MQIPIEAALREIAKSIVREEKSLSEWAEVESDDMFQAGEYVGGFDADEAEFCFSYYGPEGELWFQVSLDAMKEIARGESPSIDGREAD